MLQIEGMPLADMAALAGQSERLARGWLMRHGYRVVNRTIRRVADPVETEMEIARRVAAAPRAEPCWRCGARVCEHSDSRPAVRIR